MSNEKNVHVAQEPHDAEHCKINEHPHDHPDVDCGHYVNSGPGTVPNPVDKTRLVGPDPTAPSSANGDQDPKHGPGVGPQKPADRTRLVAPDPTAPSSANGDQDPEHGPGVK